VIASVGWEGNGGSTEDIKDDCVPGIISKKQFPLSFTAKICAFTPGDKRDMAGKWREGKERFDRGIGLEVDRADADDDTFERITDLEAITASDDEMKR
jgi:hypothetical protein